MIGVTFPTTFDVDRVVASAITQIASEATNLVTTEGNTQVERVTTEGAAQVDAVETAGADETAALSAHEAALEQTLTIAGLASPAATRPTKSAARALVGANEPYFWMQGGQGDAAIRAFVRDGASVDLDTEYAPIGNAYAAGVDGPFPALPPEFLHWTPRRVTTDLSGYATRIVCDEGTLVASNGKYLVENPNVAGASPLRQYLDTQSVSGYLSQDVSISGLLRLDNNFLTASIDNVFGHSNVSAPASGDTVTLAGSWVDAGSHSTWQVYANNRVALFPSGTDLLIIWAGQSWTAGSTDSDPIRAALSLTQPSEFAGKCLMPAHGIRIPNFADGETGTRPIRFSAYAEHVETSTTTVGGLGETPAASCARHLMRDIEAFFGTNHGVRLVSVNVAHGGFALEALGPGTTLFEDIFNSAVRDFVDTSRAAGRTPLVLAVCWTHGQGNQVAGASTAHYMRLFKTIRQRTMENIRRIVPGQYFDPCFVIDQVRTASSNRNAFDPVVRAQQLLSYEPGFVSAGEQYTTPGSIAGGTGHPTSWGFTLIGQRHARAILRSPPLGLGFTPPKPDKTRGTSAPAVRWVSASSFDVYFERTLDRGTLAADTSGVDIGLGSTCNATNWGFEYWDNSGGSDTAAPSVSIINCALVGNDVIRFTLSGTPTGYDRKLICAGRTDGSGDDALHGGGRCLVYLNDGDTRWHTSLYPIPVNEGGDGVTPKVNKLWMMPFELPLGVAS